jgi:hypothetical protein
MQIQVCDRCTSLVDNSNATVTLTLQGQTPVQNRLCVSCTAEFGMFMSSRPPWSVPLPVSVPIQPGLVG